MYHNTNTTDLLVSCIVSECIIISHTPHPIKIESLNSYRKLYDRAFPVWLFILSSASISSSPTRQLFHALKKDAWNECSCYKSLSPLVLLHFTLKFLGATWLILSWSWSVMQYACMHLLLCCVHQNLLHLSETFLRDSLLKALDYTPQHSILHARQSVSKPSVSSQANTALVSKPGCQIQFLDSFRRPCLHTKYIHGACLMH